MLEFLLGCFCIYVIFSAWKNNCDVDSDIIFNPRKSKDIDCDDDSDTFNPRKSTDIDEINEWNKSHPDDTVEL